MAQQQASRLILQVYITTHCCMVITAGKLFDLMHSVNRRFLYLAHPSLLHSRLCKALPIMASGRSQAFCIGGLLHRLVNT